MYTKSVLGVEQCQAAITAMIAEFNKDTTRRPIAMAIVDDRGDLLSYARTDGCRPNAAKNAIKKAYTAALYGLDTVAYAERLKSQGRTVAEMGDPMLTSLQGGVAVLNPGDNAVLGGIAVGGLPSGMQDEEIAWVGVKALNL
jgi:uncharacterized protein GlcG (DUF336 family)